MINTYEDSIISVEAAAKHVSKLCGKKRNRSVILRWINRGVSGVKLEAIRIGGDLFTSREALNEFLNKAQTARTEKHSKRTSEGIRRAKAETEREAEALGI